MKNIFVMSPCAPEFQKKLEIAAGEGCVIHYANEININDLNNLIRGANIIIGEPTMDQIKEADQLEWIQMTWAGTDIYTARPGFPANVILTNASGAFGNIISEYVVGAILTQYRQFPLYISQQYKRQWAPQNRERSLEGKRVLILGTGDIGSHVAQKLRPFETINIGIKRQIDHHPDQKTYENAEHKSIGRSYENAEHKSACRPYENAEHKSCYKNEAVNPSDNLKKFFDELHGIDDLEAELELADIVVGCLPNTPLTKGLLNKKRLELMKKDALLVNVGRGTLIDLEALAEILMNNPQFSAVLDVTSPEPLPEDSPLWNLANVVITPHIAGPSFGYEKKTVEKIYNICAENLSLYMSGMPLKHVVDIKRCY